VRRAVSAAAAAAALSLPPVAAAHIVLTPGFVPDGEETQVTFEVPNERPPHATIEVVASSPAGITIVSADAPPGWLATVDGKTVTWRAGRITGRDTSRFPIRIAPRVRAGTYVFSSEQRYDDGATVRWKTNLTVLPATGAAAPKQHPWEALAASLTGIAVIAGSLLALRALRRSSRRER
jgi:hypothetical protein